MDKASEHVAHFLNSIVAISESHLTELRLKLASQPGASNVEQSIGISFQSLVLNVQFWHESGRLMNWTLSVDWPKLPLQQQQRSDVWIINAIVDISETTELGSHYDIVRELPVREVATLDQCFVEVNVSAQSLCKNWDAVLLCTQHIFTDA